MNLPEIIWHDPQVNCQENRSIYSLFKTLFEVSIFTSYQEAADYINNKNSILCIITSGTNGKELIEAIHEMDTVNCIIIFCCNISYHSSWSAQYNKVVKVTCSHGEIIEYLNTIQSMN